ncbi:hypothetical protein Tco_1000494, partial [Tanacetum coccineum]
MIEMILKYYETINLKVSLDSDAPNTLNNENTLSSSSIIVDDNEACRILSTSEEPTSPISNDLADESIQEDTAELDRNTFNNPFCSPVLEEAESSSSNQDHQICMSSINNTAQLINGKRIILSS